MANITEKELELLFPETVVEIAGHDFTLKPFSFIETRIVAEKLKEVTHLFVGNVTPDTIMEIYSKGGEGVRDVIAIALNLKPQLVDKFDPQSTIKAITHIIEVNKDFFLQSVDSELENLMTVLEVEDNSSTEN